MKKEFEKKKKLMPITAAVLAVLTTLLLLVAPENSVTSTMPKYILATITRLALSAVLILIISRMYRMKIGLGKTGIVKGIFWFGLTLCIAGVFNFVGGYQKA